MIERPFNEVKGNVGEIPAETFWAMHDVFTREAARRRANASARESETTKIDFHDTFYIYGKDVHRYNSKWSIEHTPSYQSYQRPNAYGWHGHLGASGIISR